MIENSTFEKKSLSYIIGEKPQWKNLAQDCVSFANARGEALNIDIEDNSSEPPRNQMINHQLVVTTRKRINKLTINVDFDVNIEKHSN